MCYYSTDVSSPRANSRAPKSTARTVSTQNTAVLCLPGKMCAIISTWQCAPASTTRTASTFNGCVTGEVRVNSATRHHLYRTYKQACEAKVTLGWQGGRWSHRATPPGHATEKTRSGSQLWHCVTLASARKTNPTEDEMTEVCVRHAVQDNDITTTYLHDVDVGNKVLPTKNPLRSPRSRLRTVARR
jgi:hypothetical protein